MSEAEKIIAEALVADAHADDGWLSDAQTAQLSVNSDGSVSFCGEGSIDVAHAASIAVAALRDAGMLTETEWEYAGETGDTRRYTDDLEVVKRWAKRGVYNIRRRTKQVASGPWSPIPEGEPT